MAGASDERGVEVHGVGAGGVVEPAGELIALAGGGEGLAGDALGVGHALERVVAVEEDTAVGDVEDLDLVDGGLDLVGLPLGEHRHMAGAGDEGLLEVDGVGAVGLEGPAHEGVALASGLKRDAGVALGVRDALEGVVAVSEDTAVGDVEDVDADGLLDLGPLGKERSMAGTSDERGVEVHGVGAGGVIGPAGELIALAGRGEGLAGDALGVRHALHGLVAVGEDTAVGDVEDLGLLNLGLIGLPLGEHRHMAGAGDEGLLEVDGVGAVGLEGPAHEGVALASGLKRDAGVALGVRDALEGVVAVSEDTAVGDVEDVDADGLLDLGPLGKERSMAGTSDERGVEVHGVGAGGVIGPAGELIALAGRGEGLAGDALGVRHALHGLVAVGEDTAVGDVEDVDGSVDGPASKQGGMAGAGDDGSVEVHGISAGGVVEPASEVIALAGGSQGLTGVTVSVSNALHGAIAVGEDATVGDVENLGLLDGGLDLGPTGEQGGMAGAGDDGSIEVHNVGAGGIIVPASELVALAGGSEGLAGVTVGVSNAELRVAAVGEDAAVSRVENLGLLSGGLDLGPAGEQRGMAGAGDDGGAEVDRRGAAGVIVPASELVALLRGGERLTGITVGVGHALLHDGAISESTAVGDIDDAGLLGGGADLTSIEVSVGVVGQGGNSRAAECQGTSQACGRHRATNIELGHTTTLSLAANLIEARHSNGTPNDEEHVPH